MQPVLQVLALHGDVVRQVSVREKDIGMGALHALENAGEVRCAELEFLVQHDIEITLVLTVPVIEAIDVIRAMIRVFYDDGDLQTFFQLALINQTAQEFRAGGADQRNRAQASKSILIAFAEDGGRAGPGSEPWGLVTICHHGLSRAQRSGVAAQVGNRVIGTHGALHQRGGFFGVCAVIVKDFFYLELLALALDHDAASVIDLLDGKLNAFFLIRAGLALTSCRGQDDADLNSVVCNYSAACAGAKRYDPT